MFDKLVGQGWKSKKNTCMNKKIFTEKLIVATSQYFTTEHTRKLYLSLKNDNVPFTFLVFFDGTPKNKIMDLLDIVDLSIIHKGGIHSLTEIGNCLLNLAKGTDAEWLLYSDNDFEYKTGSLKSMLKLIDYYDAISPVKIDHDIEKFKNYNSNETFIDVIGWNDCAWLVNLDKIPWNPYDRFYGPLGFEDAPLQFQLWKNGIRFAVASQAVAFHHCSQDTPYCFTPEEREKYSKEWDKKAEYFKNNNGPSARWFFDNVIMNKEAVERFGFPVYIISESKK